VVPALRCTVEETLHRVRDTVYAGLEKHNDFPDTSRDSVPLRN